MVSLVGSSRIALFALVVCIASLQPPARGAEPALAPLIFVLQRTDDPAIQLDVIRGIREALSDRRQVAKPDGWDAVYRKLSGGSDPAVRREAMLLALVFGDPDALRSLRAFVAETKTDASERQVALQSLLQAHDPQLPAVLVALLDDPPMAGPAVRALAAYDDPRTPEALLSHYPHFPQAQKSDAIITLSSRPAWAVALLDAVSAGNVPKTDLAAFNVRQMANLGDASVDRKIKDVWGPIRGTSSDKLALLAQYKAKFTPDTMKKANASAGRAVFARTCGVCHTLFGAGGQVGPALTGAQRNNMDYVLGKVLDPSAVVSPNYRMTILKTKDGRVINGIVQSETPASVTLKAPNETIVVQKDDIERRKVADTSLMPEGLLGSMTDDEVRDLLGYLASPGQVPLPSK